MISIGHMTFESLADAQATRDRWIKRAAHFARVASRYAADGDAKRAEVYFDRADAHSAYATEIAAAIGRVEQ